MVMRNKHDGAGANWWDDLPPAVKKRVPPPRDEPGAAAPQGPAPDRPDLVTDLSRFAALFLVVAMANLLFLLFALWFLAGRAPFAAH